ncbi:MAG: hypothetical protein ACOC10_12595 [Bacteroidota bacterium]
MKKCTLFLSVICFLFLTTCEEEKPQMDTFAPVNKSEVNGFIQKGPFINGTTLTLSELNHAFSQTGKTFSSQVLDNRGSFVFSNIDLSTQFVELHANGYYFNEVTGEVSSSQLSLQAVSDISNKTSLNINILSHLETSRIKYLVSTGMLFNEAKSQAQAEILKVFEIESDAIAESELLDISKDGEGNAILLAISVILQGYHTEAGLSELLANLNTDLREDGVLNSAELGSTLVNQAKLLKPDAIRKNLEERYAGMEMNITIPEFEKYITQFIENTSFEPTSQVDFPESGEYGSNILHPDFLTIVPEVRYSMAANTSAGTDFKVVLKGGIWWMETFPAEPENWSFSLYDFEGKEQEFTVKEPGVPADLKIFFEYRDNEQWNDSVYQPGLYTGDTIFVEYYENNFDEPSFTKKMIFE